MQEKHCSCHESKHRTKDEVRALQNRLKRIEGQVRGLQGMIERQAYCPDVLNQVAATRAAMDAFAKELLASHIRTCVVQDVQDGRQDTVEELIETVGRLLK